MTTERKRWWRIAALAVVGGMAITGGYRLVRATPAEETREAEQTWTSADTTQGPPIELPMVAEVERAPDAAPSLSPVTPVNTTLPIPIPDNSNVAVPAVPVAPVSALPIPVPVLPVSAPTMPPIPSVPPIETVAAPRLPDAGVTPAGKTAIPTVPNIPAIPVVDLPVVPLPQPPVTAIPLAPPMPTTPSAPGGVPLTLPPLPSLPGTTEPPKALPLNLPTPVTPSGAPVIPVVPQPSGTTPVVPPVKLPEATQPMLPAKLDSGLNPPNPGNTLNPTVPPLLPITPMPPDRATHGTVVDRPKPPEPFLNATEKFVFRVPVVPTSTDPHRDDSMFKLTTTAAFAVLSGALLSAEKANAFPTIPPVASVIPMPGGMVKDDKQDIKKLQEDLEAANKKIKETNDKIEDLGKQITTLREQLNGKKDSKDPYDAGAIAKIADLTGRITALEEELKLLKKTQTSLKPAVTPEVKQTGIVKIINEYPVEISIVVNNTSHRVAPNKMLDVEVPAGDFSYQLLTAGAPLTNSKIGKGETVRLRIK